MNDSGPIDLQVNGYNGVDFSSHNLSKYDLEKACLEIADSGTKGFLAAVVTSPEEIYSRNLPIIASILDKPENNQVLMGIHIEGPFISGLEGARGVHDSRYIKNPDIELLKKMIDWSNGNIKMLTIAAELDGADKLCRFAFDNGICVSLGHQMASEDDLKKMVDSGAKCLTHLGNGLPFMLNRQKNPFYAGLDNENLTAMIITDGHHIPESLIKIIIKVKGTDKVIITSDQTSIAGSPPGNYELFGKQVTLTENGKLYESKTGFFTGSGCTMRQCVDYLRRLNIVPEKDIEKMSRINPLNLILI